MTNQADYKVSFGRMARTIVYEDKAGTIVFTFDTSVSKDQSTGKWTLYLDRRPMVDDKTYEPKTEPERQRISLGVERTRKYVETCGYVVEFYP